MIPYKTAAFYTLGCKLNFSETSTIARNLIDSGYARVDFSTPASVYVINTCSVTDNADKKCRNIVRRALKTNPDAKVIVIGCYAQLKPEEIAKIPGVTLVLGANEKFNVAQYIDELEGNSTGKFVAGKIGKVREFFPSYSIGDRTRTFLKIQDGCDYFCSFCTIPLARGKSRSHSIEETIKVAKEIEQQEVNEVVLTGVNTGDFGAGTNENFHQLIQQLDQLDISRFRISSIEPNLLSNEIIEFCYQSEKFVPHYHIPLQSGSDKLLEDMRRKYRTDLYTNRIETIKKLNNDTCIGVDVIVGFPGETEEEFMKTYEYLNQLPVSYLHVFTYSERNNTLANKMEDVVSMEDRNRRSKMLRILSAKKKRAFYESQLKTKRTVLWEAEQDGDMMHGFTENYVKVKTQYNPDLINTFQKVRLESIGADGTVSVKELEQVAL